MIVGLIAAVIGALALKTQAAAGIGRQLAEREGATVDVPHYDLEWRQKIADEVAYAEYAERETGFSRDKLFELDKQIKLADKSIGKQTRTTDVLTRLYGDPQQEAIDAIPAAALSDLPMVSFAGGPIGAPVTPTAETTDVGPGLPSAALLGLGAWLLLRAKR